jgi:hypothetical protein
MQLEQILADLLAWSLPGFLGAFGGMLSFLIGVANSSIKFTAAMFVAKVLAAFFVAEMLAPFIDPANVGRGAILMGSGFSAFPILGLIEKRVMTIVDRIFPGGAN